MLQKMFSCLAVHFTGKNKKKHSQAVNPSEFVIQQNTGSVRTRSPFPFWHDSLTTVSWILD